MIEHKEVLAMAHSWCDDSKFRPLSLEILFRSCAFCGVETHVKDYKARRVYYLLKEPTKVVSQMTLCPDGACPGRHHLMVAGEETLIAPPRWIIGWDVFAQIGHRRFSRHWSVPEIREDLIESHGIHLSEDAIEDHIGRYQAIVAARQRDLAQLDIHPTQIGSAERGPDSKGPRPPASTGDSQRSRKRWRRSPATWPIYA